MRTLRSVIGFTALVNLLALGLFAGWLGGTGRLSLDRVREIRDLLAVPVAEAEAEAARAEAEAEAAAAEAAEAERRARPPLDSDSVVRTAGMVRAVEAATVRSLRDEEERIRRRLDRWEADLARREARLEQDRQAWRDSIEEERARREDAAFAAMVARFQALKPDLARAMLERWVAGGELDTAVDVLMAVDERNAAKVLGAFEDEAGRPVAFQLLEGMRQRGRLPDGTPVRGTGTDGEQGAAGATDPPADDDPGTAARPNGRE